MKFISSQLNYFLAPAGNRRNILFMLRFLLFLCALVLLYSALFHCIMQYEGREYSLFTGLYWTLTVMSTLGFGDITFHSDLGMLFSVTVLLSGVLLFMLLLPFTFIRFVYAPWLEAQNKALTPRMLPEDSAGHVVIVGSDGAALSIASRCLRYDIPYVLLEADGARAVSLYDRGYKVVLGDTDSVSGYAAVRAEKAALVLALHDDMKNTNIAYTVREYAPLAPLAASVNREASADILRLAGCDHVLNFAGMLGKGLAGRVFGGNSTSNIIGRFEGFCIAESTAGGGKLAGLRIRDTDLRSRFGLNAVGIWQGNRYLPAGPDTELDSNSILLLAGTAESLESFDRHIREGRGKAVSPAGSPGPLPATPGGARTAAEDIRATRESIWTPSKPAGVQAAHEGALPEHAAENSAPVLILGGGRVGAAVADALESRGIAWRIVEQQKKHGQDERVVVGDAADITVLRRAGLDETRTIVVTTHNDDLNIYLTIYCRKLRPDIQIISRATLENNLPSLYSAGADLVMSQAGLAADTVINLLTPGRVFTLTEGLNIFRILTPPSLAGQTLKSGGIRQKTNCNVVAVKNEETLSVPPDPDSPLAAGDELIIIGSVDAEKSFIKTFMA
ncbi:MAG: NAD-binding protein [Desulfovibrio sp.]|jgi:Trk K+ transport system NAD-binding subunit|nr:NAD-binding protein [Desulfovibrio sp.]